MNTIQTITGAYFFFDEPEKHDYPIQEIAHALSNLCRYTGHVRQFYSVAQHSVHVSEWVPMGMRMWALLHDASEAYLGDVASPLKRLLPDYKAIEHRVEQSIAASYGMPFPLPPEIKRADLQMLVTEQSQLMPDGPFDKHHWPDIEPLPIVIQPLSPRAACDLFLRRYHELKRQGH